MNPLVGIGAVLLGLLVVASLAAPWLAPADPNQIDPAHTNAPIGAVVTRPGQPAVTGTAWLGTDGFGRDVASRLLYGGRVSLAVGVTVAGVGLVFGSFIGLASGSLRRVDAVLMRVMDGVMAIPGILLALALVAVWHASLWSVVAAIAIPEIPRVARLVRSLVLSIREEPYIEAAVSAGTRTMALMVRHVLPNTLAPLLVQGAYICASAMLVEASLSFLGVGLSTEIPTWGNMMAEGRQDFYAVPHKVLLPGACLALTVFAVNMLADGLRDVLDPSASRRGERA